MPFKILRKEKLNSVVSLIELEAPLVADEARAGQFIVLRIDETGERIPLTVAKRDPAKGVITIVFQEAGKTTRKLASLNVGDSILDLIGPLGTATEFGHVGKVVFIGGGVGVAELVPVIGYAKANQNQITTIIGARTKELVLLEEEVRSLSEEVIVMTDDGSCGQKGLVTDALNALLSQIGRAHV